MNNINQTTHRILILDADFVSSLSILRSLSRQGIHCDIASSLPYALSCSSRFSKNYYQYPDPLNHSKDFVVYIYKLLNENKYDLIIPVTERSLIPLSESSLFDLVRERLAIAPEKSLVQVLDKGKTMELAKSLGISIPFNHPVSDIDEIETLSHSLSYPVVLKPSYSIPNKENRQQLSVSYAHNFDELIKLSSDVLQHCPLLIQEYAHGVGTGIELLANHGEIVYSFQHQRIHELPLTGGGSCLRKSIPVNPILLDAAKKLISSLNWHGVAMVEFKWDPESNKYWLMEINGRFWGSLPLACAAGADFPKMLFDLLVLNKRPTNKNYNKNIYCRKLSSDLEWLEQVIRKNEDHRLVEYPSNKKIISDLALFFNPFNHFLDIQTFSDPLPGLIDIYYIFKKFSARAIELITIKILIQYHQSNFNQWIIKKRLNKANNVLFLCYGNINRSALAQAIAEKNSKIESNTFISTGFHVHDQRPADPNMVSVADNSGINLSNWRSSSINKEMVENSDIIFAMELQHLNRLYREYPDAKRKSYLLGSLTPNLNSSPEINDPYNQDKNTFINTFNRINFSIEKLLTNLEN